MNNKPMNPVATTPSCLRPILLSVALVWLCAAVIPSAAAAPGISVPPRVRADAGASVRSLDGLPYRGMYYTAGHGGTGLDLDMDASGYVFATFYTYDDTGAPTFYMLEGQYVQNSFADYTATGVMGHFEASPYVSSGGECVGDGCVYHAPTRTPTDLQASMVWSGARQATLTIGTQTWHIHAGQYTVKDEDALVGTWSAVKDRSADSKQFPSVSITSIVTITPTALTPDSFAISANKLPYVMYTLPSDGARIYALRCVPGQAPLPASAYAGIDACVLDENYITSGSAAGSYRPLYYLSYNPATGVGLVFMATKTLFGHKRFVRDSTFRVAVKPLLIEGDYVTLPYYGGGSTRYTLTLLKLPDGTVRDPQGAYPVPVKDDQ